jgi:hypothetical protein
VPSRAARSRNSRSLTVSDADSDPACLSTWVAAFRSALREAEALALAGNDRQSLADALLRASKLLDLIAEALKGDASSTADIELYRTMLVSAGALLSTPERLH